MKTIPVLRGDGIGPEITEAVLRILHALKLPLTFEVFDAGMNAFATCGELIPQAVHDSIKKNRVVLKAPITTPIGKGFRSVNVQLRQRYDLYANIRPAHSLPKIKTPFCDVDIVIFRENTEDLYTGEEIVISADEVHAIKKITRHASERIIRAAFDYACAKGRHKVTCVHKANILKKSDGLFLSCFQEIAQAYPMIESEDLIVDNACMQLVMDPHRFDVMVMPNLYGDLLSDLTSGLIGGLGVLPSANIGNDYAIFEAVHGSAPDIAGQNCANPLALLLASCFMLEHIGYPKEAKRITDAIDKVLQEEKVRTKDLGGTATTTQFADAILACL